MDEQERIPLVVIVGPTASGKTRLSIELAKRMGAEIVSADSMQIYAGMDIATAKPTQEEMQGIPHHLIGFLDRDKSFSVADYVALAKRKIEELHLQGKRIILVGGTGLYINSLVDNITFSDQKCDNGLIEELQRKAELFGGQYLLNELSEIDPEYAKALHPNNLGRIIRGIEQFNTTGLTMSERLILSRRHQSTYDLCMIGLNYKDRHQLYDRINLRVEQMLDMGLLQEAQSILSDNLSKTAIQAIGYKELAPYLRGELSLTQAVENLKRETRRYAKRQLTWFRRDERIQWITIENEWEFNEIISSALKILKNFFWRTDS